MLPTIEHSGHAWTATKLIISGVDLNSIYPPWRVQCFWDVEELFIRYPPFCKKAQRKYRKKYGY